MHVLYSVTAVTIFSSAALRYSAVRTVAYALPSTGIAPTSMASARHSVETVRAVTAREDLAAIREEALAGKEILYTFNIKNTR